VVGLWGLEFPFTAGDDGSSRDPCAGDPSQSPAPPEPARESGPEVRAPYVTC